MTDRPLLRVRDLNVSFELTMGRVDAVEQASFDLNMGDTLGLVGESGSGKSIALKAVMGLLPPNAKISGSIEYRGEELVGAPMRRLSQLRGAELALIMQDPMTALNPLRRVGSQIVEAAKLRNGWTRRESRNKAVELIESVGIEHPTDVARKYPHELSGGMRQRVLIATALAGQPKVVLCDEPTTGLDVTLQRQVLDLLSAMVSDLGAAMVFVSHDLAVVKQVCRNVQVMYAGQIVEQGPVAEVFADPGHAYTAALLAALPRVDGPLLPPRPIPGELPDRFHRPEGCRFHHRCNVAGEVCRDEPYALRPLARAGESTPGSLARLTACDYDLGIPTVGLRSVRSRSEAGVAS